MLKEKWSTGLRKGLIISLSVLLILPSALFFGGHDVFATSAVSKTLTHYYVSISQDSTVSAQQDGTSDFLVISWTPKTVEDAKYVTRATFTFTLANNATVIYRLYLSGTDSIFIENLNNNMTISTSNPSIAEIQYGPFDDDMYQIVTLLNETNDLLEDIDDHLNPNQFDISLLQVPIITYFTINGASLLNKQTDYNPFAGQYGISLNDYFVFQGYENTDTIDASNYMTLYADMDYIFVIDLASTTRMTGSDRVSFINQSGYSSVNNYRSTQKSYGWTQVIGYWLRSNKDETNTNSRFIIQWALNRLNDYPFIPLYYGPVEYCPQEVWDLLQVPNPYEANVNDVSNEMDDINDELNQTVDNIDQVEADLTSDFEDNIQAIDTTFDITDVGDGLYYSAQWLRTQFNNLTTSTPYGTLILFSMTVGLALLLIGRKL